MWWVRIKSHILSCLEYRGQVICWEDHALVYDLTAVLKHKWTCKELLWRHWGHHLWHRDLQKELLQSLRRVQLCQRRIKSKVPCHGLSTYRNTISYKTFRFFLKCSYNLKLTALGMQKSKCNIKINVIACNWNHCSSFWPFLKVVLAQHYKIILDPILIIKPPIRNVTVPAMGFFPQHNLSFRSP